MVGSDLNARNARRARAGLFIDGRSIVAEMSKVMRSRARARKFKVTWIVV